MRPFLYRLPGFVLDGLLSEKRGGALVYVYVALTTELLDGYLTNLVGIKYS